MSFINQPIYRYTNEIEGTVHMIHGEKAHSCYFSRDEYERMTTDSVNPSNKELMIIPGAVHTDLYDGGPNHGLIPWDMIESFFAEYLGR